MTKKELATKMHESKYNCAQSVACAFSEEIGVDREILFKANEGFGAGVGSMKGQCGALSGAIMLAGFQNSDGNLEAPASKASTMRLSKEMVALFEEKTGALICKDLKGIETGTPICSCPDCILAGVEVVEEVLGL